MVKQELIMDDTSNDDRSQDICLPVITCVKSEYDVSYYFRKHRK